MGEADMGEAKDCGDSDRQTGGGWHDGVRPVIDRHSSIGSDDHSDVNCERKATDKKQLVLSDALVMRVFNQGGGDAREGGTQT